MTRRQGRATSTSSFGVGARESHDSTAFYARFTPTSISSDDRLGSPFEPPDLVVCGDSRRMDRLPDRSVALVVTSPPYFAGKEYEEAMGEGLIPASYAEYLELLRDVFAECLRALEPGGRIAVNVANLGRRPYRSLSADVIRILEEDLGMLLRGEIVWKKADGASGSCAWGSFRSPTNPVLRDITERVIVASKGRFDRAVAVGERRAQGRPHQPTISTDEFLDATLDVWEIPPESARRVRHPAPFPVELPQRLIELYTFAGDLVLDPFLGSGSTAVAAVRTGRRYAGYDSEPEYLAVAQRRIAEEMAGRSRDEVAHASAPTLRTAPAGTDRWTCSTSDGRAAHAFAGDVVTAAGFSIVGRDHRIPGVGIRIDIVAEDANGERWYFDVTGAFTSTPEGLRKADTLWKCLGRASVLRTCGVAPVVLLSSDLPPKRSTGDQALRKIGPDGVHDVMSMRIEADRRRLASYAGGGYCARALPGFWAASDLEQDR